MVQVAVPDVVGLTQASRSPNRKRSLLGRDSRNQPRQLDLSKIAARSGVHGRQFQSDGHRMRTPRKVTERA
ncbi:MAG: hypothetical protein JWO48_1252 [Bryobacterales bacterium]|nr:hypothetical protein [Bryobacterales bacterium]